MYQVLYYLTISPKNKKKSDKPGKMQMYTVSLLRHIWGSGAVHFIRDLVLHNSVNTYTRQDLGVLDSVIFRAKFDKIEKNSEKYFFQKLGKN